MTFSDIPGFSEWNRGIILNKTWFWVMIMSHNKFIQSN